MKKLFNILFLLTAVCASAQQQMPQQIEANCAGWNPYMPAHYCECRNTSSPFAFPMDMDISDTIWLSSSVEDLKQGLSAYWFSNCSVTFEVYAFCSSYTPAVRMTVSADQMREMDAVAIKNKLDKMGEEAQALSQTLIPRIRVYANGCTGHVYCYPYDQGPLSTCEAALPFIPRMTYVCDQPEEVYELHPEKIASNGKGFIRWKQKNNEEATVWLTIDSCAGPEIGRAVLSDSMRVYVLNPDTMLAVKQAGKSVFVHVTHDSSYVGRIMYHNIIKWDVQTIDTTFCQGKSLQLADTILRETTTYSNDTLWKAGDTLALTNYVVTVTPPEARYDTLRYKAAQLPTLYRNQYIPKDGWGDYDFTISRAGQCDDRVLVHVIHDTVHTTMVINDTTCMGKIVTYGDVDYTTDTAFHDSAWVDADTWAIRDISIHFTEPEPEYDTVTVAPSQMTARGYVYNNDGVFALLQYGDTMIVKTKNNTCTRWIYITVLEGEEFVTEVEHLTLGKKTYKYIRNGMLYIRREGKDYDLLGRPINRK